MYVTKIRANIELVTDKDISLRIGFDGVGPDDGELDSVGEYLGKRIGNEVKGIAASASGDTVSTVKALRAALEVAEKRIADLEATKAQAAVATPAPAKRSRYK